MEKEFYVYSFELCLSHTTPRSESEPRLTVSLSDRRQRPVSALWHADEAKEGKNLPFNKAQFEIVMKKGKMVHSPLFSLYYLAGTKEYAVVTPKKVSKKAVIRNRNRRRVREILRKMSDELRGGSHIVIIKKDLAAIPHRQLVEEVRKIVL